MNIQELIPEYRKLLIPTEFFLSDIMRIIEETKEPLEGNSFYYHLTDKRYDDLFNKQVNLFWTTSGPVKKICEIGFNAGHSAFLFLVENKDKHIEFTIFDINTHKYTEPCFEYIKNYFKNTKFEFVKGDSTTEIPKWISQNSEQKGTFDVVHVDGGHTQECITNDLKNALELAKLNGLIIIDDTNNDHINTCLNEYVSKAYVEEVDILPTVGYQHRIVKRIK
jgi:hypothetical protein